MWFSSAARSTKLAACGQFIRHRATIGKSDARRAKTWSRAHIDLVEVLAAPACDRRNGRLAQA
jgi:hypothetical protein